MKFSLPFLFSVVIFTVACQTKPMKTATITTEPQDPNLWLEEIEGKRALDFVKQENSRAMKDLESLPYYKSTEKEVKKIVLAKDRLPVVIYDRGQVYNFWQDDKNVRGLWRRAPLSEYKKKSPKWETILSLDGLAKSEKENWVWQGSECLPGRTRCLVKLSRGGKDARTVREFDLEKKKFVKDGFYVPEAKTDVIWLDPDTLLVATDFGKDSLSKSGYPREVRLLHRSEKLENAKSILKVSPESMGVFLTAIHNENGTHAFIADAKDFYSDETYLFQNGQIQKMEKPNSASIAEVFKEQLILQLRDPWRSFGAGSVISIPLGAKNPTPQLIFQPSSRQSVNGVQAIKDFLIVNRLDNVQGKVMKAAWQNGHWTVEDLPFPDKGDLSLIDSDSIENILLVDFMNFLIPQSIMVADLNPASPQVKVETYQQAPARFDSSKLMTEQFEATSRDGTKIPYFVIRPKAPGPYPTLLTGYGGFEISETPYYLGTAGKVWSELGGAYVLANTRGGGEFGPTWHQTAVKENRQKVFDDFIAIADDLVARKITTTQHLAIQGGSNGGLLVGGTFTQRPDLFKAVVCQVPLLDMLRYHKLLAGHSWMAEYGDPDDPKMRQVILSYSPYQNVHKEKSYPEVLFYTSTKDDRVHPGHARKMAARMKEQGHKFLYYENTEGGHGGAANLNQRVKALTIVYTFLRSRLM